MNKKELDREELLDNLYIDLIDKNFDLIVDEWLSGLDQEDGEAPTGYDLLMDLFIACVSEDRTRIVDTSTRVYEGLRTTLSVLMLGLAETRHSNRRQQ